MTLGSSNNPSCTPTVPTGEQEVALQGTVPALWGMGYGGN